MLLPLLSLVYRQSPHLIGESVLKVERQMVAGRNSRRYAKFDERTSFRRCRDRQNELGYSDIDGWPRERHRSRCQSAVPWSKLAIAETRFSGI